MSEYARRRRSGQRSPQFYEMFHDEAKHQFRLSSKRPKRQSYTSRRPPSIEDDYGTTPQDAEIRRRFFEKYNSDLAKTDKSKWYQFPKSTSSTSSTSTSSSSDSDEISSFCRCLLDVGARQLYEDNQQPRPYGICTASLGRSHAAATAATDSTSEADSSVSSEFKKLNTVARGRQCTRHAHYDEIPTEYLYIDALLKRKLRPSSATQRQELLAQGKLSILPLRQFVQDPERYRDMLIKLLEIKREEPRLIAFHAS